jgi:hypothetical protein
MVTVPESAESLITVTVPESAENLGIAGKRDGGASLGLEKLDSGSGPYTLTLIVI